MQTYKERNQKRIRAEAQGRTQPLDEKCAKCGSNRFLVRHHPDYNQPKYVMTLCRSCHMQLHLQYKPRVGSLGLSLCPKCRSKDLYHVNEESMRCGTCKSQFPKLERVFILPSDSDNQSRSEQ